MVLVAHWFALQAQVTQTQAVAKPQAKIQRITLSSVVVKKPVVVPPQPKVEPIILPPDPEPVVEEVKHLVEPIILPPDPVLKPKRVKKKPKKKVKKKKHIKKKIKPLPIVPEVIEEIVEIVPPKPVVQQVVAPVVSVDTSSIRDAYTSEVRRQIQRHLIYPKMAKRMRMQGVVMVKFRVLKDGRVMDIRIIDSPKKLLSKGAKKTLKALVLKAIPSELGEDTMDVTIPIEFKLVKG